MVPGEPAGEGGRLLLRERLPRPQGTEEHPGREGTACAADGRVQRVPVPGQRDARHRPRLLHGACEGEVQVRRRDRA